MTTLEYLAALFETQYCTVISNWAGNGLFISSGCGGSSSVDGGYADPNPGETIGTDEGRFHVSPDGTIRRINNDGSLGEVISIDILFGSMNSAPGQNPEDSTGELEGDIVGELPDNTVGELPDEESEYYTNPKIFTDENGVIYQFYPNGKEVVIKDGKTYTLYPNGTITIRERSGDGYKLYIYPLQDDYPRRQGLDDQHLYEYLDPVVPSFKSYGFKIIWASLPGESHSSYVIVPLASTSGNDVIVNGVLNGGLGKDTLIGGAGDDVIIGGAGADSLDGGAGIDTLVYGEAAGALVDLRTGYVADQAAGDVISGFENVVGGSGNDTLYGSADANELNGQDGNDILSGADGHDTLWGGNGNDTLSGDAGNDFVAGGAGNDVIQGGAGADTLNGGDGIDTLVYGGPEGALVDLRTSFVAGQAEGDQIGGFENVVGGAGNDTLYGSADANELNGQDGNDILAGADGADTLWGAGGHDWLEGGTGNDLLAGGAGDDRVVGGAGNDALHGEAGRDTFVFETALNAASNVDWIADFTVAEDWIGLSRSVFGGFGASVALVTGTAATADNAAQVVYDDITGALFYDADGASPAAQVQFAQLASRLSLTAANFVLL